MKDSELLKAILRVKKEIQKRSGTRVCKELEYECANCAAQILIACLNRQINFLEWKIKNFPLTKKGK